jgi:hypothetical protein
VNFLAELQRRQVAWVAGLYLVGAWLTVQVAATLLPVFDSPDWVMKVLVGLLLVGAIPTLVLSWIFELTSDGLRRDRGAEASTPTVDRTARKLDITVPEFAGFARNTGLAALWDRHGPPDYCSRRANGDYGCDR